MTAVSKPVYSVAVRELIQFVLQSGDLGGKRDFVGSDRALAGTRGHQRIQRSRPPDYQKEIPLAFDLQTEEFILRIRGRIDGLTVRSEEIRLEEIKTIQGAWDGFPEPLHWAQAKYYGGMYCLEHAVDQVVVQLTYVVLATGQETEFPETFSAGELTAFFEETTAAYLEWVKEHHKWCKERNRSIASLRFPFSGYRLGQRDLAVAAYRTLASGGRLFLEAPTGIGKTISVLFPAMKAIGEGKLKRIFYLTARTVGRAIAEKALADLRTGGLRLRSVTLTAREKVCIRDGRFCEVATCPLALGYYDRCKLAMRAALGCETITRTVLERVGQEHGVCPFELGLDVSSWVDAVICDYNYVFDPRVYLRRHFADDGGSYGFLVDEAHNLVDRARAMFSAELDEEELLTVEQSIKRSVPRCAKALSGLRVAIRNLCGPADLVANLGEAANPFPKLSLFEPEKAATTQSSMSGREFGSTLEGKNGTTVHREFPAELTPLLESALTAAETWLLQNQPADFRERLLALYFQLHWFRRTAQIYDDRYRTITTQDPSVRLRLFCVDPSSLLQEALARGKAAIFFSATLTPLEYYRKLLGGMTDDPLLQLTSPFPPENLAVLIQDRILTHFKARTGTLEEVVEAIGALVQGRRGNYLIYFPSFQYLAQAQKLFNARYPLVSTLTQRPGLTEPEREAFLTAFTIQHGVTLAGFAVLGGIFGEGIDLVGEHLIGAVIVGVGLPQLSVERNLIREHFEEGTGKGFEYAYTFPGMNRVLQAIGRVIRSERDRGVVLLIDARFAESRYRRLFPRWWTFARVRNVNAIENAVASFWETSEIRNQQRGLCHLFLK